MVSFLFFSFFFFFLIWKFLLLFYISIINYSHMVCLCIWYLFGLWLSLGFGFDFRKCKYSWLRIPRYRFSLQICMHPTFQGTDFTSFSWLDLIFLVCSIYVYWIFAHVILASLHDCVSYFTFIFLFQHIQIMCVWFLFQFLIFIFCYFEFHVVVNVKVNIQNFLKLSGALHGLATSLYIIYCI